MSSGRKGPIGPNSPTLLSQNSTSQLHKKSSQDSNSGNSIIGSSLPQIGSFTQNYELYSMNKIFSINTIKDSSNSTTLSNSNNSNTFVNSNSSLNRSTSNHKSLSDQLKGQALSSSSGGGGQSTTGSGIGISNEPTISNILLLSQASSEDHIFTAMYCSNDYLIFRYVGQSKVPFYKCLIWDKDPSKKIVSMTFDPFAKWLFCLLADTSCKIISIYYTMCKKVNVEEGKPIVTTTPEKPEKLSTWMSTSRLLKSTLSNTDLLKKSTTNNSNNSSSQQQNYFSIIPQLNKKSLLIGSSCLWWKTSNGIDYGIVSTTSGHIYFVHLSDKEVHRKFKCQYPITKIDLVIQSTETYLLICTKSNGYFQLLIEQKLDHHRFETIVTTVIGGQQQNQKSKKNNSSIQLFIANSSVMVQQQYQTGQLSIFQLLQPLFQSDRNQMDRLLSNQQSQDGTDTVIASFIKSTSKLEIYEPLYLNKYPIFIYQLPPNTTNFYFTKNITIISNSNNNNNNNNSNTTNNSNNMSINLGTFYELDVTERMNISVLSNLVAGTASKTKYMNNQSTMQTFLLSPGEIVLGITKSLKDKINHHRQSHHYSIDDENNNDNNNNADHNDNNDNHSQLSRSSSNSNVNLAISNLKYTILPTCFIWTNYAIYELRPKKSPEEIFFELVSKNLEKSDGEALGKTFRMDLLSLYETAADLSFDLGQYGRALDLYYLSGVKTNKLVFKFLEIGRMDIIMTHLKAILHQSETFNVLDRKKISDMLFQCYLQKLLSGREDFKSLDSEFSNFLSTNQDYAVVSALQLLSSNGLLDYFFEVAHSRKMVDLALNMLFESDILHLDSHNISFLQSGYSQELKSHSNGLIFDCLPPNIQSKLIIEDPQNILLYFRRLYPILPYLSEKDLLMVAETFDPLFFIEPKNSSYTTTIQLSNDSHDSLFDQNFLPFRQSESIQVKNEEYFELYIITLLHLIYKRNQSPKSLDEQQHQHQQQLEKPIKKEEIQENIEKQEEIDTTNTTIVQQDDNDNSLLIHPMIPLNKIEIKCVKVSCGWDHVGVISENGELFTWGSNKSDQLGHGLEIGKYQSSPKRVEFFSKQKSQIIMIECGGEHSVAVDSRHQVYSWGYAKYGQLGHGNKKITENKPKKIEDLSGGQKIMALACGYAHTMVLKKSGDLYSFGFNEYGQLGLGNFQSCAVPTRIETQDFIGGSYSHSGKITQIGCGYAHSVLCTDLGEVYSWGIGSYLGLGINENISRPKQIESLRGVIDISCGHYHTIATTDLKNIYSWGQGEHMKLGHGSYKDESVPRNIEFFIHKNVCKIRCGLNFSVAITKEDLLTNKSQQQQQQPSEDDIIYIWGGGDHGKLGLGGDPKSPFFDKPIPTAIPSINALNILDIDCGSEFTAMITQNGGLYLWGHGKLGQIGNGKNEDAWVPTKIPISELTIRNNSSGGSNNTNGINNINGISTSSPSSSSSMDNKSQRYSQEGLEDILRSHPSSYRPYHIIKKAEQFQNWDIVSNIYDILNDPKSTLECKLISLDQKNLSTDQELPLLLNLFQYFIIQDNSCNNNTQKQQQQQQAQQQTTTSSSNYSPPMISTQTSTPLSSISPLARSSQDIKEGPSQSLSSSLSLSIKDQLLIMLLKYYHKKSLPIQDLEKFLLKNIDSFSGLLSNIIQINVKLPLPLIIDFSSTFYLSIIKNYLQQMNDQSNEERKLQKVSEKILWTNIRENLEKDLLLRSKIEIPSLPTMMDSGSNFHLSSSTSSGGGPNEKDIAFTCNHFFTKRNYFGNVLPDFRNEIQKLSIISPDTLKFILDEYYQRSISMACPICLLNAIRDLKHDDVAKNNIIKLFKLS